MSKARRPARFERLLSDLRQSLGIEESDLLGASYSDLLEAEAQRIHD